MKTIDFTHPGGFPLTQDGLDYLQGAYTECLKAFAAMGVDGSTPIIVSGMEFSVPGVGEVAVSDGWFFFNNELIKFIGGTQFVGIGGTVAVVEISAATINLTYNDGSVYPAIKEKTATIISSVPISDATHFVYTAMQPLQVAFGKKGKEQVWQSLPVSTSSTDGGVIGTLYYKKNFLTNTLQVRGILTANNALNFAASPYGMFYTAGTMPAGYIPANNTFFTAHFYLSAMVKDDLGVAWIKEIQCTLTSTGDFNINWIKPDSGTSSYGILLNFILPLD